VLGENNKVQFADYRFKFFVQHFKAQWLLYVPWSLTFNSSTFCPHSVFVWI